jgi:putative ABC transport system ATP-binding protein
MQTGVSAYPHAVRLSAVTKRYGHGGGAVIALDGVSIGFPRGSFTAVMGPSGSGKSTFLHCAAGLDRPTAGRVLLGTTDLTGLSETQLTLVRRRRVGFVFQSFNLVPALTALQNIALPLRLAGLQPDPAEMESVVELVGLTDRVGHMPAELSGGQQQRVAIARALATRPEVVFADEPTGALDMRTGRQVMRLLRDATREIGQTVIMVTHDPTAAALADSVVFLVDGRLSETVDAPSAEQLAARMTRLEA